MIGWLNDRVGSQQQYINLIGDTDGVTNYSQSMV